MVFYTTVDGTPAGIASAPYTTKELAAQRAKIQNDRAEELGITARYQVASAEELRNHKNMVIKPSSKL